MQPVKLAHPYWSREYDSSARASLCITGFTEIDDEAAILQATPYTQHFPHPTKFYND